MIDASFSAISSPMWASPNAMNVKFQSHFFTPMNFRDVMNAKF